MGEWERERKRAHVLNVYARIRLIAVWCIGIRRHWAIMMPVAHMIDGIQCRPHLTRRNASTKFGFKSRGTPKNRRPNGSFAARLHLVAIGLNAVCAAA